MLVAGRHHFAYADGAFFSNIGTTCYAWAHQGQEMIDRTLRTLSQSPFNKLRMCVFPKSYLYNRSEPPVHGFAVLGPGRTEWGGQSDSTQEVTWQLDFTRFEPAFFQNIDRCILGLLHLGIQADVIVLHPYDRWGYATMPAEAEDRYLRYLCARLSAFRNIWWSLCNEWDLMRHKTSADWERVARIVRESDPYGRLMSIHNAHQNYDHSRPWVTHVSLQGNPDRVGALRRDFGKPVVVDECGYEGNIFTVWGSLSAQEMTWRFWLATCLGGYCGHGETYDNPREVLWWSHGGSLSGQSPQRLAGGLPGRRRDPVVQQHLPALPLADRVASGQPVFDRGHRPLGDDGSGASRHLCRQVRPSAAVAALHSRSRRTSTCPCRRRVSLSSPLPPF